jgi:hypothetical protein
MKTRIKKHVYNNLSHNIDENVSIHENIKKEEKKTNFKELRSNAQNAHSINRPNSHSGLSQREQTNSAIEDFTLPCKNNNNTISTTLKNKIYFWLIDINILKENAIKVDDIPLLCTNGVLLCDLINRLEGVR